MLHAKMIRRLWIPIMALLVLFSLIALIARPYLFPQSDFQQQAKLRSKQEDNVMPSPIRCRIAVMRDVVFQHGPCLIALELINNSDSPAEIRYGYWPHKHISLEVLDSSGRVVFQFDYSSLASVVDEPHSLLLAPGQSYKYTDDLFRRISNAEEPPLNPGKYTLRCYFQYGDELTRSEDSHFAILAN